ncbi:MAG TPA: hypothetical protein VF092_08960 [Longimicrobium sp.]
MRRAWTGAAAVLLAGCASAGAGTPPQRTTGVVEVAAAGRQASRQTLEMNTYTTTVAAARTLAAAPEAVWAALDSVYASVGIPVVMRDPRNWTLGNRNFEISRRLGGAQLSRYFTCGSTAMGTEAADSYRMQLAVWSTVRQEGSGSRLETTATAMARQQGTSGAPLNCASTGELEKAIANRVSVAVGG